MTAAAVRAEQTSQTVGRLLRNGDVPGEGGRDSVVSPRFELVASHASVRLTRTGFRLETAKSCGTHARTHALWIAYAVMYDPYLLPRNWSGANAR